MDRSYDEVHKNAYPEAVAPTEDISGIDPADADGGAMEATVDGYRDKWEHLDVQKIALAHAVALYPTLAPEEIVKRAKTFADFLGEPLT